MNDNSPILRNFHSMKSLSKISFLLIIVVFLWELPGQITSSSNYNIAEIQSDGPSHFESQPLSSRHLVYLDSYQNVNGFIVPERIPVVTSLTNQQDKSQKTFQFDSNKQNNSSSFLLLCSRTSLSLTVKEIIFPFHTFL